MQPRCWTFSNIERNRKTVPLKLVLGVAAGISQYITVREQFDVFFAFEGLALLNEYSRTSMARTSLEP